MAPDILVGLISTVIPTYNAYKFGCYYYVYDPDWFVLTLTNFLWWMSAHDRVSVVTEILVQPQCPHFFVRALSYLRYVATMFYSMCASFYFYSPFWAGVFLPFLTLTSVLHLKDRSKSNKQTNSKPNSL